MAEPYVIDWSEEDFQRWNKMIHDRYTKTIRDCMEKLGKEKCPLELGYSLLAHHALSVVVSLIETSAKEDATLRDMLYKASADDFFQQHRESQDLLKSKTKH